MRRIPAFLLFLWIAIPVLSSFGQEVQPAANGSTANLKTVVVAKESKSDSVVAVPPATSVTMGLKPGKKSDADGVDLHAWLAKEQTLNGLLPPDLQPWHIVVTYDQFDEDGDNVHSGVFEEFWISEKKYKRIYKSDNLNQTEYGTEKGLFRQGDQKWPDRAQSQVRSEVVTPFYYADSLEGVHAKNVDRKFTNYLLQCVWIESDSGISDPTQYCFEPGTSVLRYTRGEYWYQTVYNHLEQFQGRNVAREVDVTDGGKPYLKLRVDTLELLSPVDESAFLPPHGASGPLGDRVSGVQVQLLNMAAFPKWPASLNQQQFVVALEIVIGKDGHVISTHAVSGPPEAFKACEDAVRKWLFKPYLVLGKPVEVEQKVQCAHH